MKLVERVGDARLPTDVDTFRIVSYRAADGHEHVALIAGDPAAPASQPVLVRLHSECLTGDVLGSAKCDCGQQLLNQFCRKIEVDSMWWSPRP